MFESHPSHFKLTCNTRCLYNAIKAKLETQGTHYYIIWSCTHTNDVSVLLIFQPDNIWKIMTMALMKCSNFNSRTEVHNSARRKTVCFIIPHMHFTLNIWFYVLIRLGTVDHNEAQLLVMVPPRPSMLCIQLTSRYTIMNSIQCLLRNKIFSHATKVSFGKRVCMHTHSITWHSMSSRTSHVKYLKAEWKRFRTVVHKLTFAGWC